MAPRLLIALLAACAAPARPAVVNHQAPARVSLDLGIAFAPQHHAGVLAPHAVSGSALLATIAPDPYAPTPEMCANANAMTGDGAAVGCDEDPAEPKIYDLDGDGVADLAMISHRSYLGGGDRIYVRDGQRLVRAFDGDTEIADERADTGGIALRFERGKGGDLRTSYTLRYDVVAGRWDPPLVTLHARAGEIPAPQPPYARFEIRTEALLEAAPDAENSFATLAPHARGYVVATVGNWSFVAVDPATPPSARHVVFPLDADGAWLCGWISRP